MGKGHILAIDLGTSSMKCVCYDSNLSPVAACRMPYTKSSEGLTGEDWWTTLLLSLRQLMQSVSFADISCISFSGYNALVGVDAHLRCCTPVITYNDSRPVQRLLGRKTPNDSEFIFQHTGNRLFANGMMANSICFLAEEYQSSRLAAYVFSNGFLAARLTGHLTIDIPRASLSLLMNPLKIGKAQWDDVLLDYFGIQREVLPDLAEPDEIVGVVSREASLASGLVEGTPVLAGAMDSVSAVLGSGVLSGEQLFDIGGSAGGLAAHTDKPGAFPGLYTVRSILPKHWVHIGPLDMSGSMFTWFVEHFLPDSTVDEYFARLEHLPALSPNVMFLPYVGGSRHPYWSPDTDGHFVEIKKACTIDDLSRAVMDGVACAYRHIYNDFQKLGIKVGEIVCGGGDTRSREWLKTKANFLHTSYVTRSISEMSARGCAIIGAVSIGVLPDYAASLSTCRSGLRVMPDLSVQEKFDQYYYHFLELCGKMYKESDINIEP